MSALSPGVSQIIRASQHPGDIRRMIQKKKGDLDIFKLILWMVLGSQSC